LGLGKSLTGLGLRNFKKPWAWACPTKFSTPELLSQMTKTWWEAPMGGSVLSFLKAE
jgi:hypothetical protein